MDHCFYVAKRTVKPAFRNHSPGGFWVLLNAQKYQGKMYFWPILVTLLWGGDSDRAFSEIAEVGFADPPLCLSSLRR